MITFVKQYRYPPRYHFASYMFALAFCLIWVLSFVGLVDLTDRSVTAYTEFGVGAAISTVIIAWVIWASVSTFCVFILLMILMAYPNLELRDTGFRVSTILGRSQWLDWQAIKKVRVSPFGQKLLMIGCPNLNWTYWPVGLVFRLGSTGFLISGAIEDYDESVRVVRTKRPDLFRQKTPDSQFVQ